MSGGVSAVLLAAFLAAGGTNAAVAELAPREGAEGLGAPAALRAMEIEPRGGPVGTEVALRMAGLPAATEFMIGFGGPRAGYEWIGRGESDGEGTLAARVRVPAWSEANELYYLFVTLPEQPPLATSPGFHVTAADGSLRVTGELVGDPASGEPARLRGAFDEIYCLSSVPTGARPGVPLTVEGTLGAPGSCREGIPVQLEESTERPGLLSLWREDRPAFGVYVPSPTEAGGRELARNPLYDFLFLDLEREYDAEAVRAVVAGVRSAGDPVPPSILVRIPPISDAGEKATRARMLEALALGGDGLVVPHIRSLAEARSVIGVLEAAGVDVWSPANPEGEVVLMLMLEDPETVAQARAFAELEGYSVLACGIGSLAGALGGDREAAEAGARRVLEEARRVGLPDMITANPSTIAGRVAEGYLALLLSGPTADEAIRIGREAAGRD